MMLRIVRNKLSVFHPKIAAFSYAFRFSSLSALSEIPNPSPKRSLMVEFLIKSCGLSSQKAASAFKRVSMATSIEQADSVRHFFKHHGFDDASIRKLILGYPPILSANVEETLKPNLKTLADMFFTQAELQALILSSSSVIVNPLAITRLEFWENFLQTNSKEELVKFFTRNWGLICHDIVSMTPKIALLKERGFSDSEIATLMKRGGIFILLSVKRIEALLKRAEEIGFDIKSSLMILYGLSAIAGMSRSSFARKMEFFKGFGWSEQEFLDAFKKSPLVMLLKDENIGVKMEFLVGRVGCKQSYISSHLLLLSFSLMKRLKPRHHVMEMLRANKQVVREMELYSIMCINDKKFVDTFIVPYKDQVLNIHETYVAACAGEFNFERGV